MAKDGRKLVTRAKIVAAAVEHFGHHGFDGTKVTAVAEQAAVSHAAVHFHFGDKTALYAVAVRAAGERFLAAMRRDDDGVDTPFAMLAERWVVALRHDNAAAHLLRGLDVDHRHPAVAEAARWVYDRFVDFWRDRLREPADGSQPGPDPAWRDSALVVAVLSGLAATMPDRADAAAHLLDRLAALLFGQAGDLRRPAPAGGEQTDGGSC